MPWYMIHVKCVQLSHVLLDIQFNQKYTMLSYHETLKNDDEEKTTR